MDDARESARDEVLRVRLVVAEAHRRRVEAASVRANEKARPVFGTRPQPLKYFVVVTHRFAVVLTTAMMRLALIPLGKIVAL